MHSNVLGIDIGSVSMAVAEVSLQKKLLHTEYTIHGGDIVATLRQLLNRFDLRRIAWIATTASTPQLLKSHQSVDNRVAVINACRSFHGRVGSILLVGGEKFGLIQFDAQGNYRNFKANTSCAAGTGSFLDQQAQRLKLAGSNELSAIAFENSGNTPKIASRCAVFAKTDLVHAQQEGYTLAEICDGLCRGLARNIVDTLFVENRLETPLIFTGGVSKNKAVVKHLEAMIGVPLTVEEAPYGAVGAALDLIAEGCRYRPLKITVPDEIFLPPRSDRKYFFEPLTLQHSEYPDFSGAEGYLHLPPGTEPHNPVEVDIYEVLATGSRLEAYLGIDIGSTSTKGVLLRSDNRVVAGFYTRTAGRPVKAVQRILATMDHLRIQRNIDLRIIGVGTTGSGRKFSGRIIGADLVVDEISAHARAAYEIDPQVDTIIEIGGQDSKFTTLHNGMVTFAVMNAVCAAGTGSFIEEQASKLGCPLEDYSKRTEGRASPIVSDRCTVFMERDINHYLSVGYTVDEVLAAVLHSIRENYLCKVAVTNSIGGKIAFQGATAKNRALVAAFEQYVHKPIQVSKYCHLTGALGVALMLADAKVATTEFKGIALHAGDIPIRSEVCDLCTNHCKITVAEVEGAPVAYGFLCGRDYETRKHVNNNRSGFDLLKARNKIFRAKPSAPLRQGLTIGIPAALHLYEDLELWRTFFDLLGIETVTSEGYADAVKAGKRVARAEFCAPMAALHGHVAFLLDKADYIFLPFYLEHRNVSKKIRRQYCYYTQYAPALAAMIGGPEAAQRFLMPLTHYLYNPVYSKVQLYRTLRPLVPGKIGFKEIAAAYDRAQAFKENAIVKWQSLYKEHRSMDDGLHVVLMGRPYTVLSAAMNKGIPDILASLGVKAFFQDMLNTDKMPAGQLDPLLNEVHWHFAAKILRTAALVARSDTAYPVLITSFKCTPDAFVIEYFKKVMETSGKPYLILQLDEHDSRVGYETRIEAALRSFYNHRALQTTPKATPLPATAAPAHGNALFDKTLLLPNWDDISLRLVIANLRRAGIDARLLEETETSIQKSLRHNTGQCLPLNIIAQEFIDYVEQHDLDPARSLLWMMSSKIACNLGLFPYHIKQILNAHGRGMERAGIYYGRISYSEVSMLVAVETYFAYMFGGFVKRMGCKLRPYEKVAGATDRAIADSQAILVEAFDGNRSKETAVTAVVSIFERIDVDRAMLGTRPKVAVFGDLYARDNDVFNQDLIRFIEANGGEVVTTPYSAYVQMIANSYLRKWLREGNIRESIASKALISMLKRLEKKYYASFARILEEPEPSYNVAAHKILAPYNLIVENTGESMDNIVKLYYLRKHYPDLALLVQVIPAFCCPSIVTEAMAHEIERKTGIPIVSITYDGTGGNKNDAIIPYLKYPRHYSGSLATVA